MKTARIVLDTNVAVSAFLWGGKPAVLIELAGTGAIRLFNSKPLIEELETTLAKPKLAPALARRGTTPAHLVARYLLITRLVRARALAIPLSRDPDDDHVIACAIAAKADAIISGDDDLLSMKEADGISILTVTHALEWLEKMNVIASAN